MDPRDIGAESASGDTQKPPPTGLASKTAPVQAEKRGSEYLANERTFLAWIRTSVAVISLGFLVGRFGLYLKELGPAEGQRHRAPPAVTSFLVGDLMMAFGAALAILAAWRYHVVNRAIERGEATADPWLILLVTILVTLLAAGMMLILRP